MIREIEKSLFCWGDKMELNKDLFMNCNEGLKQTEISVYEGCELCDAGYLNGKMCNCLKEIIKQRKYKNSNIDYEFSSLEIYDEEIDAKLKIDENEFVDINVNKFVEEYIDKANINLKEGMGYILHGNTGRGKSLTAMKTVMKLTDKNYKCYFITVKEFIDLIKSSWDDDDSKVLLKYIYDCDFLVFDDLGVELQTDWAITELDKLFRHRYFKKKPVILTTNYTLKDIKEKYAKRIVSLFHERLMFIVFVTKTDYREKLSKMPSYMNIDNFKEQ